jgi:lactoylglutathione lyase
MRLFSILGVQQVAMGGTDKQQLRSCWLYLLGIQYRDASVRAKENIDEDICQIGSAVKIDPMQPPENIIQAYQLLANEQ